MFTLPLWALKLSGNIWFRRAMLLVVVAFLLLAFKVHYINQGKEIGKTLQKEASKQDIEAERQAARKEATDAIKTFQEAANLALENARQKGQLADRYAQENRSLERQRDEARAKLTSVKDSDLHQYITDKLALRPKDDNSAGYTFPEERAIAGCLDDQKICKGSVSALGKEVAELRGQVQDLNDGVTALNGKYTALATYTTRLERDYTTIFNMYPKKGNLLVRIVTLGLGGKPKKLPVPNPEDLKNPAKE